ncbi:hypothetical protein LINPERHAP2_LOCUS41252 [Linum perenne]
MNGETKRKLQSVKQIQRVADLVFLLADGEIVEVVTPEKLCEAKHLMAVRIDFYILFSVPRASTSQISIVKVIN